MAWRGRGAPGWRLRGAATVVVASVLPVAAPGVALAQDETIAADPTATDPSALRGVQVWVRDDSRRPDPHSTESDRLVQRVNGVVADAPIRDGVASPDLGTDASGRVVAVYQRCTGSMRRRTYNCDIYSYRPGTRGRERKVKHAASSRCHESAPSMWRGVVVVMRIKRRRGCSQGLFVIRPNGRARRLSRDVPDQRPERSQDDVVITDIHGSRVLYLLSHVEVEATGFGEFSEITLFRTSGGRGRQLADASFSESDSDEFGTGNTLADPMLDGDHAYWLLGCHEADEDTGEGTSVRRLVRRPLTGADQPDAAVALDGAISSFAVDGSDLFFGGAGLVRSTAAFGEPAAC